MSKAHFAIIGAGPTGLEAALAADQHGYDFTLYEASDDVAGHVRGWGHVRLFTPWSLDVSPRMRHMLELVGHEVPASDDVCPTGAELVERVFRPLAKLPWLERRLRLGHRVRRIGRQGLLKHEEIGTEARGERPFRLLVVDSDGHERVETADLVLDCSGNARPAALGDAGIPAPGERHLGDLLSHDVPSLPRDEAVYAGKSTLLVGAGHSAQTALRDLLTLATEHDGTHIAWVFRSPPHHQTDDPLPSRERLTGAALQALEAPPPSLQVFDGHVVDAVADRGDRVDVTLRSLRDDRTSMITVDRLLALTGRVGDHRLYRELQVHECYATAGPMKLAAALLSASGGAGGDCLQVAQPGPDALRSPEPGFFILGSKSYGRRNDFLLQVGWRQVDEIFQLLD
ncbi:MAG: NAD(P)-binding protein [Acidobacteriota bacterium]